MGIVFSGMFAVGLILVAKIESDVHLLHILFGNVLGISNADLLESSAIAAFASLAMLVKRRDIVMYCFDPVQAQVVGLRVKLVHFGLLALLALTIVSALKAVGIILVVAMLIAPGSYRLSAGAILRQDVGDRDSGSSVFELFRSIPKLSLGYR